MVGLREDREAPADAAPTASAALERVLARAADAAPALAALPRRRRAELLVALADALEAERAALVAIAERETGLAEARLAGEVTRTAVQLRLFAETVAAGAHLDVRIDEADPHFALGVRPELRRTQIPVGPVLNFSASNFPFAFSVLGGDSASILAAGCPLIVKAHSGHPELSDATAALARRVVAEAGLPEGTVQVIHGQESGVAALRDPRVRAGSFTGSTHGGRILADIAASRPAPIPFYGELGSINPVFITRTALDERAAALASEYLASVGGSAGQLCTKPGLVFAPTGGGFGEAVAVLASGAAPSEHRLLGPRIAAAYASGLDAVLALDGVELLVPGAIRVDGDEQGWVTPTVARVSLETLRAHRELLAEELFGPFSVVIEVPEGTELAPLVDEFIEGSLTGTVHLGRREAEDGWPAQGLAALVQALARRAGRVLFNDWPTGVAVTPAQQHGGPWPATTNDSSTSVGTAAVSRFLRPVAFQNAPERFLPEELRDDAPPRLQRRGSAAGDSLSWGKLALPG
nr:aldehyde dehydrogenase (NADP(+)) [Leucobacter sp. wl10]